MDERTKQAYQQAYRAAGYKGDFGGGQATAWKKAQGDDFARNLDIMKKKFASGEAGARPTTVASFNPYQRESLTKMGQPSAPVDPRVSDRYEQAGRSFDAGSYKQFMNPYLSDVLDAARADVTRGYDMRRKDLREEMAAAGGFGSTAQGVEQALLTEAQERQLGNMSANLRAQGFSEAMGRAQDIYGSDISKNLAIAGGLQGLDAYGRNVLQGDLSRQLAAGERIQQQSQDVLDAYYGERGRAQQYPYGQLDFYRNILGSYPTGETSTQSQPGVGMAQGALGGALLGGRLFGQYGVNRDLGRSIASNPSIFGS